MKIHHIAEISRHPADVFPWIADPKKALQWQKDVKRAEILLETPGVTGTTFKEIVEEGGNELEMTGVVTQFSPNAQVAFHLSSKIHDFDVSYALRPIENGTRISIDATIRWKFPMNIVSLLIGRRIGRQLIGRLQAETEQLRRFCEGK